MTLSEIAGLQIEKVSQKAPYVNMLIYGESGVGKTLLAGSSDAVPSMRRVLIIDVEGGTLTLRDKYPNVEAVRVKNWQEMQNVYDALYLGTHGFNTIVIDSLTEVQKLSMDSVMRRLVAEHEERDADVPGLREWNINLEQTRKFVRAFRDLPTNTIFTALAQSDKNTRTGAIKRKPSLSGKVKDEVAGFLDIVVYLYIKEIDQENVRMLLCGQTEDTVAKDRSNALPMTIQNPTMDSVWQCLSNRETAQHGTQG
jgi:phage nucleotide-binding protein